MIHREKDGKPCATKEQIDKKPVESRFPESSHLKELNKRKTNVNFDHEFVSSFNIPKEFIDATKPFYSAEGIYKLWSRLNLVLSKTSSKGLLVTNMDDFIKTFKESIYAKKQNKVKGDFFGYVYGAFKKTALLLKMQSNARSSELYYDWLS